MMLDFNEEFKQLDALKEEADNNLFKKPCEESREVCEQKLSHFIITGRGELGDGLQATFFADTQEKAEQQFMDKYKDYNPEIIHVELDANAPFLDVNESREEIANESLNEAYNSLYILDLVRDALGDTETLEALAKSMSDDELKSNLDYICRMYNLDVE